MAAAAGASFASTRASAQPAPSPAPSFEARLTERARENRRTLRFDGRTFSGPGWDLLVTEGRAAEVFLLGEEHGIAENAKLAGALFAALAPAGYRKAAVEVSPVMAAEMDRTVTAGGVAGLRRMFEDKGSGAAFFGMREEAEWLAAARRALGGRAPFLWGFDYEVGGFPMLVARLAARPKPPRAEAPMAALSAAVRDLWGRYEQTRDPLIPSFGGDPAWVRAVRAAWLRPDPESEVILTTLEETLEINRLYFANRGWESNQRRADFNKANLIRLWRGEQAAGRSPRLFCKFGASHMVRGRSATEAMDLGTTLHELAALRSGHAFSVMVLPGDGAEVAAFDPSAWTYRPRRGGKDEYAAGLDPLLAATEPGVFSLIDMRPLRPLLPAARARIAHPELVRSVHGFDALLVMNGSTASANL